MVKYGQIYIDADNALNMENNKLGEAHKNSMLDLTFDPRFKVKVQVLGIRSFN